VRRKFGFRIHMKILSKLRDEIFQSKWLLALQYGTDSKACRLVRAGQEFGGMAKNC
jgi:hypothetical protein